MHGRRVIAVHTCGITLCPVVWADTVVSCCDIVTGHGGGHYHSATLQSTSDDDDAEESAGGPCAGCPIAAM